MRERPKSICDFSTSSPHLPRQNFSARWRGYFFVSRAADDRVLRRRQRRGRASRRRRAASQAQSGEGMRTIGRKVRARRRRARTCRRLSAVRRQHGVEHPAGARRPAAGAIFSRPSCSQTRSTRATCCCSTRRAGCAATRRMYGRRVGLLLIGISAAANFGTWRRSAAPRSVRDYAGEGAAGRRSGAAWRRRSYSCSVHTRSSRTTRASSPFRTASSRRRGCCEQSALNWLDPPRDRVRLRRCSPSRPRGCMRPSLFAVGLLLWGQGNLWNADYGVLAGQDVDLAATRIARALRARGWAAALLVSLVFFRPISRIAPFASLVFLGVQTAAVAASGGESDAAQRARWIEPPAAIYQFSATRNVIHIVLDEFQSDVFDEILPAGSRRRSIGSSAASSISPTTPARSRRRRSACRRC